jgi:hypothetical protein
VTEPKCVACLDRVPLDTYLANDYLCETCVEKPWPRELKELP